MVKDFGPSRNQVEVAVGHWIKAARIDGLYSIHAKGIVSREEDREQDPAEEERPKQVKISCSGPVAQVDRAAVS
jgi:hypothetical protein